MLYFHFSGRKFTFLFCSDISRHQMDLIPPESDLRDAEEQLTCAECQISFFSTLKYQVSCYSSLPFNVNIA